MRETLERFTKELKTLKIDISKENKISQEALSLTNLIPKLSCYIEKINYMGWTLQKLNLFISQLLNLLEVEEDCSLILLKIDEGLKIGGRNANLNQGLAEELRDILEKYKLEINSKLLINVKPIEEIELSEMKI